MILEELYESGLKKSLFFERKVKIDMEFNKLYIYGSPKSGKSSLVYDFLTHQNRKFLYIDFADIRVKNITTAILEQFIEQNFIKLIVFDSFNFQIELPKVEQLIIISDKYRNLNEFKYLHIKPLDFEEYISFDRKFQSINSSFNQFLKDGNLPEIISLVELKKLQRHQEIIRLITHDSVEVQILVEFIKNISNKLTLFQLFNILKSEIKISKDRLYQFSKSLVEREIIFLVERFNQPKAPKKIFSFSFALFEATSFKKDFARVFENMVFLELSNRYNDIYYTNFLTFYIPSQKKALITIPFVDEVGIEKRVIRVSKEIFELQIEEIEIITINFSYSKNYQKFKLEATPFLEWALMVN